MRQYIVLSDLAAKPTMQRISTRSLAGPFWSSARTTAALRPRVEVQHEPARVGDIRRKPGNRAVALMMAKSLIWPEEAACPFARSLVPISNTTS
jgi:hypothetical protein